ncbi:MAG: multidrug efflux RND transporter permease subunit [Syntrophobacteraceae bacterium]|jgi:HAE1 family hydrophobic/amphiphilic exporter-1
MLSRFFIDRPIFASVLSIIIVIAGLITFKLLPISQYPDILPPSVVVSASYPGADAKVLADTVAQPIEEQVNGVEGMLYMSSTCSNNGQYQLTVTFATGTDLDMAAVRVQNRLSAAEPLLPEEVKRLGVIAQKQSSNIVMFVNLISSDEGLDELYLSNFATLHVKDELSRLDGVGSIMVFGAGNYSMRVWLDPEKLKARGLTTGDVVAAIREQNVQVAAGQVGRPPVPEDQNFQYVINTTGRLADVRQFEDIILKSENSRQTRVRDVARVELGSSSYDVSSTYRGRQCSALAVFQLPGANALQVTQKVEAKMAELSASFPKGVEYKIPFNTTRFISTSIHEVIETLIIASLLVFVVILIFLQDWRASLIPAVTIPVCLIGTFCVMGLMGISVNIISLFGIVLAIGIVVDDAIVVVENASRHIEESGMSARDATIKAMEEVTGPIIATTLVLLAVFTPTAFLRGISGQLYRQFGLTIATATAFSALNALTMSPALCAIVLRPTRKRLNIFYRAFNWTYGKGRDFYIRLLQATVRRSVMALPVFAVLAAAAYWGFSSMPTGFLPSEDQGYAMLSVQLPDASSKSRTNAVVANINEKLAAMPGIESWISVTGYSLLDGATSPNAGAYWIIFDPWKEREKRGLGLKTILGMLWQQGSTIEEASVAAFPPPAIIGLGEAGGFQVQLQDRGNLGLPALEQITEEMVRDANGQAALKGVFSTFRANVPQLFADIDRTQAKTLDVQLSAIFDTLQAYLGSVYVNDFNKFGRTYQVNIQADAPFRRRIEDIRQLEVRNAHGDMVPLGAVLRVKATQGPQIINRFNMYPSAALNGEAAPGFSSGQAISVIEKMAATKLPANTGFEWTGMAYQEKAAGGQAMGIFMMAVTFVYLVLCAQYESWSIPLSVILVVPLGLLGTVIGLTARGMDVNMYTQIGIVLLIGMACKTAILIVEFAKANRESGKTIQEAAMEASVVRFRPIVMTGAAFIAGVFPLVIASGAGAASRQALGTAVFGGMIAATALMVIFVPAFYVVIQSLSERLRPQRAAAPQKSKAEDRLLDPGR